MSATLGVLLEEKYPNKKIIILERLPKVAEESSEAWNNAGTGHSGYCELNYTPEDEQGNVDISKAIKIAESFQKSLEFWKKCESKKIITNISKCLNSIPHHSFVEGKAATDFLEKRHQLLTQHTLFKEMKFSKDWQELKQWFPLIMENRNDSEPIAATRMEKGFDVNFGEITDQFFDYLNTCKHVELFLNNEVEDLTQNENKKWTIDVKNQKDHHHWTIEAAFVFIGAGGGTLPLLEKANITEAEGYGGFPISGQWLRCKNRTVIEQHNAKVYGKAKVGAPPMSVPHLDTRIIESKKELLFGPFAGFSTKFLKNGSYFDLPLSMELDNFMPMLGAGFHNIPLTKYLIQQVTLSMDDRIEALREFYPNAKKEDWELVVAGQRVQVIKKDEQDGGKLEFGTEVIVSSDKTIAGLLGASPGASTSYSIMKKVMDECFD